MGDPGKGNPREGIYSRSLLRNADMPTERIYPEVSNTNHFGSVSASLGRLEATSQCIATLDCLGNPPVRLFISKKMPTILALFGTIRLLNLCVYTGQTIS